MSQKYGLHDARFDTKSIAEQGVIVSDSPSTLRIAFLGNSMLYFNDCPRLLAQMMSVNESAEQDSCLRPNASLSSLWVKGNGMQEKFRTPAALRPDGCTFDTGSPSVSALLSSSKWDVVVMNDHSQAPVRMESKEKSKLALKIYYWPLLRSSRVVLLQTAAYREQKIHDSEDLGSFEEFDAGLRSGYLEYKQCLEELGVSNTSVAPFGAAVRHVKHQNPRLWQLLYGQDGYHPSPHGTWLMACVLHCTILRQPAPPYNADWWKSCRYFETPLLPLPTLEEAQCLGSCAWLVCNEPGESSK